MPDKNLNRIRRQFDAVSRLAPPARRIIDPMMRRGMRWVRLPFAFLLIAGGVFSFLPVLGLWMLPIGFLFLAVDIPPLRPSVAAVSIRTRRRLGRWTRRSRSAEANR